MPRLPLVYLYITRHLGSYLYNRAAAASMIMFLIISVCSAILFMILRDKEASKLRKLEKNAAKRT